MNKGFVWMFLVMIVSMILASMWNAIPAIKTSVHAILDPSVGLLLNYNVNLGMIVIVAFITLAMTLVQKYTTDQATLKRMKEEQKILQKEMQKYKEHPEKLLELQKKQFEFMPKTFELTIRPLIITAIPIILFFRWFNDYFIAADVKIFGFIGWLWAYLIFSIIFSMIFRKIMNVY